MDHLDTAWSAMEELEQAIAEEDQDRISTAFKSLTLSLNEYLAGKAEKEEFKEVVPAEAVAELKAAVDPLRKTEEEVLLPARHFFSKDGAAWKACADKAVDALKDNLEKADLAKALMVFKDLEDLLDPAVADKFVPSNSPTAEDADLPEAYVEQLQKNVTGVVDGDAWKTCPREKPGPIQKFLQAIGRALLFRRKVVPTSSISGPLPFSGAGMTPEAEAEVKKIVEAKEAQRGLWKDHLDEPKNAAPKPPEEPK
jgi:hypothetical protein